MPLFTHAPTLSPALLSSVKRHTHTHLYVVTPQPHACSHMHVETARLPPVTKRTARELMQAQRRQQGIWARDTWMHVASAPPPLSHTGGVCHYWARCKLAAAAAAVLPATQAHRTAHLQTHTDTHTPSLSSTKHTHSVDRLNALGQNCSRGEGVLCVCQDPASFPPAVDVASQSCIHDVCNWG